MIERLGFKGISFEYAGSRKVFTGIDFEFPCDQNILISSDPSGGKSTLLKLLAGLVSPSEGSYLINEEDVAQMSFEEFLPFRHRIGYSFDFGGLMANRTLWDNLTLPLLYHNELSIDEVHERVHGLMDYFKILSQKDTRPAAVSGAMRKATIVARAFVMNPAMILLDDPFVGLDHEQSVRVLELIEKSRKNGTLKHVFLTSNDKTLVGAFDYLHLHLEKSLFRFAADPEARKVVSL